MLYEICLYCTVGINRLFAVHVTAIDVGVSVTQHDTGSIVVPGNSIQLVYVLTLTNVNEPDWNSDVAPVEPNLYGDNFEVSPLPVDVDIATSLLDYTFMLTASFSLTDGSLGDGINASHPLNLTYTATVSTVMNEQAHLFV